MAGIQLAGLASGMDWKTTVDQLMQIETIPQDTLKSKQALVAKTQSAFDTLKTNLTALSTAATGLQTGLAGFPRSAKVSAVDTLTNASDASVSTISGASIGTYGFNVTSMGKASTLTGGVETLRPNDTAAGDLTLSAYGVTEGTFTINGTQYTISSADLSKTVTQFFGLSRSGGTLTGQTINGNSDSNFTATISPTSGALSLDASGGTGSIGAVGDTSNFLAAMGLSYSAASSSASDFVYTQSLPSATLAKLTLADFVGSGGLTGTGDLSINGVSVGSFGSTSTLGSVVSAINGTSATGVTASIDAVHGRLILTANAIGSTGVTVTAGAGLDAVLGMAPGTSTLARGNGVTYDLSVNGASIGTGLQSDSTTIDISKYGYGATQLTVSNTGNFNVQVTGSGADYKTKINTFISAYNTLKTMLDDSTKITVGSDGKVQTSVFSGRSDINNLLSSIRSKIYTSVSGTGVNSSYDSMSKIGIGFDSSGVMSITDSAKLDSALANSPTSVDVLMNANKSVSTAASSQQGVATRIYNLMTALTGTSGLVSSATTSLTSQTKRLQTQIDAYTRSLAQTRKSLEAGFIAMEQAQSRYTNMASQLTAAFK